METKLKITIKKLHGDECILEVLPSTTIREIKRSVRKRLHVPIDEQKLLCLGKTLYDYDKIESYPNIKDGTKINLVVIKPETLPEYLMKCYKKSGLTESEAAEKTNESLIKIEETVNRMSLDDLESLIADCVRVEKQARQRVEKE